MQPNLLRTLVQLMIKKPDSVSANAQTTTGTTMKEKSSLVRASLSHTAVCSLEYGNQEMRGKEGGRERVRVERAVRFT
jgi:hypothetical protein